ncbi:Zinc finger BED domain-containing protein 4-like [Oopsacas minuta]|uniref:Zinc finger BED domain-containing protein 4-like n=1 Tax=Oopsacas minuta TaxID=111878 RepID=A0AAV7KDG6_9METZ|nr:Zinc finger BED domain-containing protein 4-like [Oopsacas minuta]
MADETPFSNDDNDSPINSTPSLVESNSDNFVISSKQVDVDTISLDSDFILSDVLTNKHKSRPAWYDRCVECGWIGMALPNSLHNLKRHYESLTKYKTCKDRYLTWIKERELLQPALEAVIKGETKKMSSESQEKIDKLLAEFIIASELPLRLVELREFLNLLNELNARYKVPYRRKLKDSLLTPMLKDSRNELSSQLDKCPYASLTIDGWSSRGQLKIDIDEGKDEQEPIDKMILSDARISTFEFLSDTNLNSLTSKLRAAGLLPLWGRCVCHLIQLSVHDFIQKQLRSHGSVNKIIIKATQFVNCSRKSIQCGEIFLKYKFTLGAMNQTRWDSMYKMLKSILDAETKGCLKFLPSLKYPIPKNYELAILREVVDVLEPIHLFTLEFESSLGTSGMVIPGLESLYDHLNSIDSDHDSMSQIMLRLAQERFSEVAQDHFMIIANCVDPRFATKALFKQSSLEILK